jgi:peptide/nickel transport system substrate-binding protein
MQKIFLISVITILAAVFVLSGCSSNITPATSDSNTQSTAVPTTPAVQPDTTSSPSASPAAQSPKYGGTLKVIEGIMPSTNIGWPADTMGNMGAPVMQFCLETLLRSDSKGNVYPWLAESYQVADDLKSMTLKLRKGIKFHDGSDFNAEVAKWNLDNYLKQETNWSSVDVIDDYTIRINFKQWINTLPSSVADISPVTFMVSKTAFDKNGKAWMKDNPVGTGPFKFVSFTMDSSFKAGKNPDYWKKDAQGNPLPYLDGIEILFIADQLTQKLSMQTKTADMATFSGNKIATEYAQMGLEVKITMMDKFGLLPDTANADSPWANQKVREALEYAIDREAIAKSFGYGYSEATYQMPPRTSVIYDPNFPLNRKYDMEKAKQLLAEAGYADGFKTTIICFPDSSIKDIATTLQAFCAKVGIQVDMDYPQGGKFMTYMGSGTWHNAVLFTTFPALDPTYIGGLQWIFNMNGQSWERTSRMKEAYQNAISSPEPDIKLTRAVTDMITEDASIIPIFESGQGRVQYPYVMADFDQRGSIYFWNTEETWLNK